MFMVISYLQLPIFELFPVIRLWFDLQTLVDDNCKIHVIKKFTL